MCSLDVRFSVECVFDVIFSVKNSKIASKTHSTVKRTSKLHIQNVSVIDPLMSIIFLEASYIISSSKTDTLEDPT
jgi:hypothetical protein